MANILISSIGSISADITIKNLKKTGNYIIGCDSNDKSLIVDSMNVDLFYNIPLASSKDYLKVLFDICIMNCVEFIIPLADFEIDELINHFQQFNDMGVKICLSNKDTLNICRNKYIFHNFLREINYNPTINTIRYTGISDIFYPCILKPSKGRSSEGIIKLYSKRDLYKLGAISESKEYICQPIIDGPIITADLLMDPKTKTHVIVQREELLRNERGLGLAIQIVNYEKINELIYDIVQKLEIKGAVNFEFIKAENNDFYLIEINPRFSGGIEFSCIAGYDFINNHLNVFKGQMIESKGEIDYCFIARKYEEFKMGTDKKNE